MERLFDTLHAHLINVLENLKQAEVLPQEADLSNVALEQPKDETHGDLATNAALVLAKQAKTNPRALAEQILPKLLEHKAIKSGDVAGPGFINLRITGDAWLSEAQLVLADSEAYTKTDVGHGQKVMVEFVSINPTGPIHIGHGRNAVLGDTLCRLLEKTGYNVYREYLVNDAGNQILTLVLSVHARYLELFGEKLELPEDGYVGEYIIEIAQALKDKDGNKWLTVICPDELLSELREFCVNACMDLTKGDLDELGIWFDRYHSEWEMHQQGDPLAKAVKALREKEYVYEGKLEAPKGKDIKDYQPVDLTLFKATEYGAEQDKPIYNRRGNATYFGQDIAYHQHKLDRGFERLITVIGADQQGNFTPLKWALEALTGYKDVLHPFYYAHVKTLRDGQPVKLSKRAGNIIALSDVVREVGGDVYRFHMLTRKGDTPLTFDLAKAVEKSMDNPVFYVQYAYARMAAVFRQQEEMGIPSVDASQADTSVLNSQQAINVLRHIILYPQMLEKASVAVEPHRIAFYAMDFAAAFHSWYNAEKFLDAENLPATYARLLVVQAAQLVLKDVLAVMHVTAPEKM
ncbi:MAG: arginine--tRNA ligase [Alphaproteobacteria bacterium]|nr:arginine--tRNA ligase [Alphaproteobacteria bacterium]MDD9920180.1 arginine--tRNA ligase [Alphaproteobacteria bacterium]